MNYEADITQVFGEAKLCLDYSVRGVKGKIRTKYSSRQTEKSFYISTEDDRFFIPSNVYIIATMNGTANNDLRRDFAQFEMRADGIMDIQLGLMRINRLLGDRYEDYKNRAAYINGFIRSRTGERGYMLGAAYYANIRKYYDKEKKNYGEALGKVWDSHIAPVIAEYFEGKKDLGVMLETLRAAFTDPEKVPSSELPEK